MWGVDGMAGSRDVTPPGDGTESGWAVDRSLPQPLYHQVYRQLRDAILNGLHPDGDELPSEQVLERRFGVSRITVRRAVEELARLGLVERRQGRATRVCRRPHSLPLAGDVEGELRNTLAIGLETEVEVIACESLPAPAAIAVALALSPGSPVLHLVRLRRREGLPFCHTEAHVPAALAAGIDAAALLRRPLLLLLEEAGVIPARVEQSITAVAAAEPEAGRLEVAAGTPLLRLNRVVHDLQGRPVQEITALFRPDRYDYRLSLGAGTGSSTSIR